MPVLLESVKKLGLNHFSQKRYFQKHSRYEVEYRNSSKTKSKNLSKTAVDSWNTVNEFEQTKTDFFIDEKLNATNIFEIQMLLILRFFAEFFQLREKKSSVQKGLRHLQIFIMRELVFL